MYSLIYIVTRLRINPNKRWLLEVLDSIVYLFIIYFGINNKHMTQTKTTKTVIKRTKSKNIKRNAFIYLKLVKLIIQKLEEIHVKND